MGNNRCSQCGRFIFPHTDSGHHQDLGNLCEICKANVEEEEEKLDNEMLQPRN